MNRILSKYTNSRLSLIIGAVLCIALLPVKFHAQAPKTITLDDCFTFFKFYPQTGGNFQYLQDGAHYVEADHDGVLHFHDLRNEQTDSSITLKLPEKARGFDQFEFSEDETKLLIRTETEPVYRHSVLANYFVYDFKSDSAEPVFEQGKQQFVALSPTGNHLAFVFKNNLYVKDLSTKRILQVTRDGEPNKIINGLPDWVYEEEFSPVDGDGMVATRWSPDGTLLAFLRFDETAVPEIPLTWYEGGAYPQRSTFKYPKVGEANSTVSVHLYDLSAQGMVGKLMGLEPDDYCPRLHWTPDNQLVMTRLNRRQDTIDLLLALPDRTIYMQEDQTNWIPTRLLLEETDAAYVEIESENKLVFLKDTFHFLWMSERSGWQHIYKYDMSAPPSAEGIRSGLPLTKGKFDVTNFYGVDEKNGKFYFQAATPTPLDRQIWEGDLNGGDARLLTPPSGTHEAAFSPTFDYFTHIWSDANTPPVVNICDRNDDTLRVLNKNDRVRKLRKDYGFVQKEFFQIPIKSAAPGRGGWEGFLNGWMLRPAVLDTLKKYPVLFDNYGGPNSQTVQNQYDGYMGSWHQMLVQKGYIVVSVDNRGTGARGRDFRKCTQLQLGKLETEDQIAAARYLGSQPWADPNRIGIWGWSFGGYLSTSCILKGADVFKMAMAVAPVVNWKWYDSVYTERYMHTTADNAKGYEDNSPLNFADRLRGDNYLICHGMSDDNVHWQQTVEMINALIKANKQFETYYYPNRNHGIYGENATKHLFTKLTNFVLKKL
ncbi:MAG: S9 family peptidase [Saprospiraceae bacterium]|nr:S9 family peptidase [Saprospiraceae bacterium]